MNQQDIGRQIRKALDQGLSLDEETSARLDAARQVALGKYRARSPSAVHGWAHQLVGPVGGGSRSLLARVLVPALLLSAGLIVVNEWYQAQITQDLVQIDEAVLTGDLPLDAYLDSGFQAWLKRSSSD